MNQDVEGENWEGPMVLGSSQALIRTFFIFIDFPQHIEFRVGDMPFLVKGTEIELDMTLRNPRNHLKTKKICGVHSVSRNVLKYSTKRSFSGLSQYLELIEGPLKNR